VLEAGDPNQLNGYDYAGNDPVTGSDPSGLRVDSSGPACGTPGGAACWIPGVVADPEAVEVMTLRLSLPVLASVRVASFPRRFRPPRDVPT